MFDRREDSGRVDRIDHSDIWKMKGDVHDPGKYRGITLLSQVLKLLERVLDGRIPVRKKIECEIGEEQQGFRKGRGTTDGLFMLRQFVEKKLEKQGSMCIKLVLSTWRRHSTQCQEKW